MSDTRSSSGIVLLLPQNSQHLETIEILLPHLVAQGLTPELLLMDGIFHQGLEADGLPSDVPIRSIPVRLNRPFYRLDPIRQTLAVIRCMRPIRRAVGRPDVILMFNDGALQRLAVHFAPGARMAIVIDGMISDYDAASGAASKARTQLRRIGARLRRTLAGVFLPSDVGVSPVDTVFVLGEHAADVLQEMGTQARQVVATGLPRWPNANRGPRPKSVSRVLYLTGSFAWHGRHDADRAQVSDVQLLAQVCRDLGLELVVRVHPRDDAQRWSRDSVHIITARDESMWTSILAADVVMAMVSTGLLEAITLGRIARPVIISDAFEHYERSFVADPMLRAIKSEEDLRHALASYLVAVPEDEYALQAASLAPYVAATGAEAGSRIARKLAELAG